VQTGSPCRDLWTSAQVNLDPETVRNHDVWLSSV
jgi:hypothetical protein